MMEYQAVVVVVVAMVMVAEVGFYYCAQQTSVAIPGVASVEIFLAVE